MSDEKLKITYRSVESLIDYARNPRKNDDTVDAVAASIQEFGFKNPIIIDREDVIIAGHARAKAAKKLGLEQVPCVVANDLTPEQVRAYRIIDNRLVERSEWDSELLRLELDDIQLDLEPFDLAFDELGLGDEAKEIEEDEPPEVQEQVVTELGDMWILGTHRVLCGDSTKREDIQRLMVGATSVLLHADPPYGMGKESDGIANDNLYREKLDAFQMQWWRACRPCLADNASAYIWGNAEDLWRLWYCGGLRDSERLTFRNEIVWDKSGGVGIGTEMQRCYFPQERCLFFMLGEQGFNNNADNYWEGWEPIRKYLDDERKKMGWREKDLERICGVSSMLGHWFTRSQWAFITEKHYRKLQAAGKNKAFKKDYEVLKKEFYKTRAYFDNTHDNMTEVWQFGRVVGEERHGHATPKPVKILSRILLSSSPAKSLVVEPFLGSGTTLIAAEQTDRKCYGLEISPQYCDVIVRRWEKLTRCEATLDSDGSTFAEIESKRLGNR